MHLHPITRIFVSPETEEYMLPLTLSDAHRLEAVGNRDQITGPLDITDCLFYMWIRNDIPNVPKDSFIFINDHLNRTRYSCKGAQIVRTLLARLFKEGHIYVAMLEGGSTDFDNHYVPWQNTTLAARVIIQEINIVIARIESTPALIESLYRRLLDALMQTNEISLDDSIFYNSQHIKYDNAMRGPVAGDVIEFKQTAIVKFIESAKSLNKDEWALIQLTPTLSIFVHAGIPTFQWSTIAVNTDLPEWEWLSKDYGLTGQFDIVHIVSIYNANNTWDEWGYGELIGVLLKHVQKHPTIRFFNYHTNRLAGFESLGEIKHIRRDFGLAKDASPSFFMDLRGLLQ